MVWKVYQKLLSTYGKQNWWPAETPFEVCVGAILTQNTNWQNVEKAIENLKSHNLLFPEKILSTPLPLLQSLIKPAGFYKQKANYLKNLSLFIVENGGLETLKKENLQTLRKKLLKVKGIGRETADSILLYALNKKIFVIDAYTKRLFYRLGITQKENEPYENLRTLVETEFNRHNASIEDYKEFHALIVKHCKEICRKTPDCKICNLKTSCMLK
jgi:endonuclease-3 related protein